MDAVVGIVSIAGQYEEGFDNTHILLAEAARSLKMVGLKTIIHGSVIFDSNTVMTAVYAMRHKEFDILCVCVGTWSEDHYLLDFLEYIDKPVILWAFPAVSTGSLCGAHQICCVLKELNREYYHVYGDADDRNVVGEIIRVSKAAALRNKLKHVKIGNIGGRISGMTETAFDELEIKDRTGVRIVGIDEEELNDAYTNANAEKVSAVWNDLKSRVGKVTATDSSGIDSVRYYLAMKHLINTYRLEGIAIKCYPKLMGKVCLGYSMLSEEGIVCGCEGDVNNTVSMKILYELSGMPTHNTDILYPDAGDNTILFSHCGSGGFSLAANSDDIHLGPVRLAGSGACTLFPARTGPVTLVNIVGRKGTFRMSVMAGEAVECGMIFAGDPLKVKFAGKVDDLLKIIAREGIGHHWIGGYGDFSKELEYFCASKQIRHIRL